MHLTSLFDLSADEISALIAPAIGAGLPRPDRGRLAVLLDFLPLGAEGLALRAAAVRVGVQVVEARRVWPGFGEHTDLLDVAAAAGAYADLLVVRHPLRGAARAAALVSKAPVLSAGDGCGEDPLFALADLAGLRERLGKLEGRSVALCGDLRRNRRAHALAAGLLALKARVLLVPARGAEPEQAFLDGLSRARGSHPVRFQARSMASLLDMVDSWLLTPDLDHQLSLYGDLVPSSDRERRAVRHQVSEIHAMWVAAARDERGEPPEEAPTDERLPWRAAEGRACVSPARPDQEEETGKWAPAEVATLARALLRALAGPPSDPVPRGALGAEEGIRCGAEDCVAAREPVRVRPAFLLARTDPVILSCVFCGTRRKARYVGSRRERRFHELTSTQVRKIHPKNLIFFGSRREAEAAGFVSSRI